MALLLIPVTFYILFCSNSCFSCARIVLGVWTVTTILRVPHSTALFYTDEPKLGKSSPH